MFPCGRMTLPMTRREMLARSGAGFGAVALAALAGQWQAVGGEASGGAGRENPLAPRPGHFPARARQVIFLYMDGGPSQVDTFDPKPRLERGGWPAVRHEDGADAVQQRNGNTLGCPWKFAQYGQSGLWISDLFPHVARHADQLAVVRSMTSNFSEHTSANYFLHTGLGQQGRPSMGAWCGYGLGSRVSGPARLRRPQRRLDSPRRLRQFRRGLSAGQLSGLALPARRNRRWSISARGKRRPQLQQNKLALLRKIDAAGSRAVGSRRSGRIGHRQL